MTTSDPEDRASWPLWTAPVAVLLGLILGSVGTIVVDLVGNAFGSSLSNPSPATNIAADVVFDLGFVVTALVLASVRGRPRLAQLGYRRVAPSLAIGSFVIAAIAYYGLSAVYQSLFALNKSDKLPSDLGVTHSTAALIGAAAFVCVIAPIAEELFFRGFLFGTLRELPIRIGSLDLGPWIAAVLVGILFGAAHLGSAPAEYLIPLGFLGFVLCLLRWRTGSLYPCMALHSANNALALGVVTLHWAAGPIVGLIVASWLTIAAVTGPLASRRPRLA